MQLDHTCMWLHAKSVSAYSLLTWKLNLGEHQLKNVYFILCKTLVPNILQSMGTDMGHRYDTHTDA